MVLDEYCGIKIVLFYDDYQSVKRKTGRIVKIEENMVFFVENDAKNDANCNEVAIPISRIIRVELDVNDHKPI